MGYHPTPPPPIDAALATAVLDGLCDGSTLHDVCAGAGMPGMRTVLGWAELDAEFAEALAGAQARGVRMMIEADVALHMGHGLDEDQVPRTASEKTSRDRLAFASRRILYAIYDPARFGGFLRGSTQRAAAGPAASAASAAKPDLDREPRPYVENAVLARAVSEAIADGAVDTANVEIEGHVHALSDFVDDEGNLDEARLKLDFNTRMRALYVRWGQAHHPRDTGSKLAYDLDLLDAILARPPAHTAGSGGVALHPP
jgi:hypothetical protein